MNALPSEQKEPSGFTLTELLVVLATLAFFGCLILPALGDNRAATRAAHCLNNLEQLGKAWLMYADDHLGRLVPNKGGFNRTPNWVAGWLDFTSSGDNTNTIFLIGPGGSSYGFLGPYLRSPGYFKCPSDASSVLIASQRLARVRSYSMNNFVGDSAAPLSGAQTLYQLFPTLPSIGRPTPAQLWVITEEHPESINEGTFYTSLDSSPTAFVDLPAAYHSSCGNFLFADGHADSHRWDDPRTLLPLTGSYSSLPAPGSADLAWLQSHATDKK